MKKNEQSLPQNFEGYSTAELLQMWKKRADGGKLEEPLEKRSAMAGLMYEYRLAPVEWGFTKDGHSKEREKMDMIQAKKLLAPFGLDPAPWVDAEGNRIQR